MGLTFEPFRIWFITKHPTKNKMDFLSETGFSPSTASKVWKDRFPVRSDVIEKICETYNLEIEQVIRFKREND